MQMIIIIVLEKAYGNSKKFSRKREAILTCLHGTTCHPTAEWVYQQLKPQFPDLSLGTVYRNLAAFKAEGVIDSVGVVNGLERYDGNTIPHARVYGNGTTVKNNPDISEEDKKYIFDQLMANFNGECSEVGMYLCMARIAHREGYPEIGLYWEKAAYEEAEHAAKFAEMLGSDLEPNMKASTKDNLKWRVDCEFGATSGKFDLALCAKKNGLDAILPAVARTLNGQRPLRREFLSDLMHTVRMVRRSLNPDLELEGVLLTMFDGRTNLALPSCGRGQALLPRQGVFDRHPPQCAPFRGAEPRQADQLLRPHLPRRGSVQRPRQRVFEAEPLIH